MLKMSYVDEEENIIQNDIVLSTTAISSRDSSSRRIGMIKNHFKYSYP